MRSRKLSVTAMVLSLLQIASIPVLAASDQLSEPTATFDRLFTSATTRSVLDAENSISGPVKNMTPSVVVEHRSASPSVILQGILVRSDGKERVWLDTNDTDDINTNIVKPKNLINEHSISVRIGNNTQSTLLKPGQVWLPKKGRVEEVYNIQSLNTSRGELAGVKRDTAMPLEKSETNAASGAKPEREASEK